MDMMRHRRFMDLAFVQAKQALARLEVPVGCVVVEGDEAVGFGSNRSNDSRNATRHAEMEAIDGILQCWRSQEPGLSKEEMEERFGRCELYVTVEPCIMCAAALAILGLKKVYYGTSNDRFGGCGSVLSLHLDGCGHCGSRTEAAPRGFQVEGGLMAEESVSLLRSFYEQGNPNAPRPHRPAQLKRANK